MIDFKRSGDTKKALGLGAFFKLNSMNWMTFQYEFFVNVEKEDYGIHIASDNFDSLMDIINERGFVSKSIFHNQKLLLKNKIKQVNLIKEKIKEFLCEKYGSPNFLLQGEYSINLVKEYSSPKINSVWIFKIPAGYYAIQICENLYLNKNYKFIHNYSGSKFSELDIISFNLFFEEFLSWSQT